MEWGTPSDKAQGPGEGGAWGCGWGSRTPTPPASPPPPSRCVPGFPLAQLPSLPRSCWRAELGPLHCEKRAGAVLRARHQRPHLLAAAATPGCPGSRDAAGARGWRAAQRLQGHVRWPRPPVTRSLTARVSCSMLSCSVRRGPPAWSTSKPRICSPPRN
uniref:uncharacterized protein LOC128932113 isoform X1 n=1 Tax=Callithrix jacchus TaxID=9483 RepID=UPI0023DD38B6|nr:uncharacterized protein LOC128932113 isoform X1 [Callithrix jacchus]